MSLNIYYIWHPIPFPSSEYGGVWIVSAETEQQAAELVSYQIWDNDIVSYFGKTTPKDDFSLEEMTSESLEESRQEMINCMHPQLLGNAAPDITEPKILISFVT